MTVEIPGGRRVAAGLVAALLAMPLACGGKSHQRESPLPSGGANGDPEASTGGVGLIAGGRANGPASSGGATAAAGGRPVTGSGGSTPAGSSSVVSGERPPLTDCTPLSHDVEATACALGMRCGTTFVDIGCRERDAESWECTCSLGRDEHHHYEVVGRDAAEACRRTLEACSSAAQPTQTGPVECSKTEEQGLTRCHVESECLQPIEIDGELRGEITRVATASCSIEGQCNCAHAGVVFDVPAESAPELCDTIVEHCSKYDEILVGGRETCTQALPLTDPGYWCRAQQTCSRFKDLADGITASSLEIPIVSCVRMPDGGLGCDCVTTSSVGSLRFNVEPSSDRAICSRLLGACRDLVALEVDGPVSCTGGDVSTSGEQCSARIDCTQQGMLGDESVVAHGSMFTSCSRGPDLTYLCQCNGGTGHAQLEVAADDATAACDFAVMQCPELVEPTIGRGPFSIAVEPAPT